MAEATVEIPAKVAGEERKFKFKRMTLEEATEWSQRLQARSSYYEAASAKLQVMRDEGNAGVDEYLKLADDCSRMMAEILKVTRSLSTHVIEPTQDILAAWMAKDIEGVVGVFTKYMESLFPTQGEIKNS
jgi:hypothetical protein